jgi:hypothetical protein
VSELSTDEAIGRARDAIAAVGVSAARAWRVRRIDLAGDSYYLVVFGADAAAIAVVVVGAARGEIRSWATLSGTDPHRIIPSEEAIELAGTETSAQAELVWKPCSASRSPLFPLWEIRTPGHVVYVDQQRHVWPSIDAGRRGG